MLEEMKDIDIGEKSVIIGCLIMHDEKGCRT